MWMLPRRPSLNARLIFNCYMQMFILGSGVWSGRWARRAGYVPVSFPLRHPRRRCRPADGARTWPQRRLPRGDATRELQRQNHTVQGQFIKHFHFFHFSCTTQYLFSYLRLHKVQFSYYGEINLLPKLFSFFFMFMALNVKGRKTVNIAMTDM